MNKTLLELYEVTDLIKSRDWAAFKNNKSEFMNPKSGLYILIFENSRDVTVNDRNINKSNKKNPLSGKVVIPSQKWAIKFGKFERCFLRRMKEYSDHMHFIDTPQKSSARIFGEVIRAVFMLPLDGCSPDYINPAAMFEPLWNSSLHNFLVRNDYLTEVQNFRSEYRIVKKIEAKDLELIFNFSQKVADKISKISNLL